MQALAQSEKLRELLDDDTRLPDFIHLLSEVSTDAQAPRDCVELIVWCRFYQLDR